MSKKLFLMMLLVLSGVFSTTLAQVSEFFPRILLQVIGYDPTSTSGEGERGPVMVPQICLDNHILYVYDVAYELTLVLLDENENVVYTIVISANTTSVILPATLTGDFILQLYPGGNYYFEGEITL